MVVIRPIALDDLDPLVGLADQSSFSLTTLPRDRELLQERILESQLSFERKTRKPRDEIYIFTLADQRSGKIVGTCGIVSKVGGFEPFYAYRIETSIHESKALNVRKEIRLLHLVREHSGPSEIGGLFLSPESRKSGCGRLLSLSRFLFMAEFPDRFEPLVIAEMRGVIDERGRSPLWEALGKHFFDVDFPRADYLSMKDKGFIAALMPTHPIYTALLPREAQEVIGQVHPETRPALKMLQQEGFAFSGMVDIFEGGPIIISPLENLRTVRESVRASVAEIADEEAASDAYIVSNASWDFRACATSVHPLPGGGVRIPRAAASALGVKAGDPVRFAPIRPGGGAEPGAIAAAESS